MTNILYKIGENKNKNIFNFIGGNISLSKAIALIGAWKCDVPTFYFIIMTDRPTNQRDDREATLSIFI